MALANISGLIYYDADDQTKKAACMVCMARSRRRRFQRSPGRKLDAMNVEKRKRLEAAGWRFGNAADFLGMTPQEEAYVELKLHLADALEAKRKANGLTQKGLAARLQSSQSRVAMMEKGDPSVSIDLLVRGLFALGMRRRELAKAI